MKPFVLFFLFVVFAICISCVVQTVSLLNTERVYYNPTENHGIAVNHGTAQLLYSDVSKESNHVILWPRYGLDDQGIKALVEGGAIVRNEQYVLPERTVYMMENRTVLDFDVIIPVGVSAPIKEENVEYSIYSDGCVYVQYVRESGSFMRQVHTHYSVCSTACGSCEVEREEQEKHDLTMSKLFHVWNWDFSSR